MSMTKIVYLDYVGGASLDLVSVGNSDCELQIKHHFEDKSNCLLIDLPLPSKNLCLLTIGKGETVIKIRQRCKVEKSVILIRYFLTF